MDLYAILGVARGATPEQIKTAFRKLAKKHHPDIGGDKEKFETIQQAYEVLVDQAMRAEYDRTGELPNRNPDNSHIPALQRLGMMFDQTLGVLDQAGTPWTSVDLVDRMKATFAQDKRNRDDARAKFVKAQNQYKRLLGRFKTGGPKNLMEALVRTRVADGDVMLARLDAIDALDKDALALLEAYRYAWDLQIDDRFTQRPRPTFVNTGWSIFDR